MKNIHPLLKRQIKKIGLNVEEFVDAQKELLDRVSRSYVEMDAERYTMQRSFELSSKEMELLRKTIEEERAYLKSIMSEALITVNQKWQITSINPEGMRLLKLTTLPCLIPFDEVIQLFECEDLSGQIDLELIKDTLIKGNALDSARAFLRTDEDAYNPISYSLSPLFHEQESQFRGAVFILRDSSEHLQFERALEDALDEAQRLSDAKTLFLANMSHEIRTPINGVLGMLQVLATTELSQKQSSHLQLAQESAQNLLVVIDDILDFAKFDAGMVSFEKRSFNVHEEFHSICDLLSPQFTAKKINLALNIQDDVPTIIETDSYRLRQVMFNLTSNALKFTPKGGEVTITLSLDAAQSNRLHVSVCDTGVGIDSSKCNDLFDSFFQTDQSTTRLYGGSGLGLAICKQIVEQIGGVIQVESTLGQGSCFHFTYPFSAMDKPSTISIENDLNKLKKKSNVLLVDDNELNLKVTEEMLQLMNCEVTLARHGQEALEMLETYTFDIVFMDCHMPVMDGYEATRQIRQREHQKQIKKYQQGYTVVIALTANAFQASKDKCFACGMDDYISKPFQMEQLHKLIHVHVSAMNQSSASSS